MESSRNEEMFIFYYLKYYATKNTHNAVTVYKETDQTKSQPTWLGALHMRATKCSASLPFQRVCQMTEFNWILRAQCVTHLNGLHFNLTVTS